MFFKNEVWSRFARNSLYSFRIPYPLCVRKGGFLSPSTYDHRDARTRTLRFCSQALDVCLQVSQEQSACRQTANRFPDDTLPGPLGIQPMTETRCFHKSLHWVRVETFYYFQIICVVFELQIPSQGHLQRIPLLFLSKTSCVMAVALYTTKKCSDLAFSFIKTKQG